MESDAPVATPPSSAEPSKTAELLLDHAREMWKAEEVNSARLENRAKLIQSLALALIAFAGIAVYRAGIYLADPGDLKKPSENPSWHWLKKMIELDWAALTSTEFLYIVGVATTISPLIFGVICLFGCLANELRRGEDDFLYPVRPTRENVADPQPTWREVSVFYGIGNAVAMCYQVIFKQPKPPAFKFGLDDFLDAHRENDQWLTPRPVLRRFLTASNFLQFPESSARDAWKYLRSFDPHTAEVFRATYLASNSLRRWNQRKIDEIRISETLLAQGILLLALSVVVFVNLSAFRSGVYPVAFMLALGILFGIVCHWIYRAVRRKRRAAFTLQAEKAGYIDATEEVEAASNRQSPSDTKPAQ